ncbi:MAG: hypothetical protein N2319_02105 [Candidatus Kapabacteria bacterium]|nr:hypothetical protein [Candidatus Kapabacteria bacterium]
MDINTVNNKINKEFPEDKLFNEYLKTNDEKKLLELVALIKPWLSAMIFTFVQNEQITVNIIKETFKIFIIERNKFDTKKRSIIYEIFLIAKSNRFFWS